MKKARTIMADKRGAARAKPGRKPMFRSEHVIRAALDLVDRDGHEALSMRAIAAQLGTGVATLYNYFASIAELKDALAIVLLEEIPLMDTRDPRGTRRQLKETAMAYSRVAARYPDFEQMVGPLAEHQIMRLLDSALRAMLDAGVDIVRAGVSWSVLQSLAQTHATESRRLNNVRKAGTRKTFKDLDAVLTLANTGVFKTSRDEWFDQILDLTIDRMLPELKAKGAES